MDEPQRRTVTLIQIIEEDGHWRLTIVAGDGSISVHVAPSKAEVLAIVKETLGTD